MSLPDAIRMRAASLAADFGLDVDEALVRWEEARVPGSGDDDAGAWVSVAFVFSRELRAGSRPSVAPNE